MPNTAKEWTYTYKDLCELTGKSTNTVAQAASRGSSGKSTGFDPSDFKSVLLWVFRHSTDELRVDIMSSMAFFRDPEKAKRIIKKNRAKKHKKKER